MGLFGSSTAPEWFGAAKRGNLELVDASLAKGQKLDARSGEYGRTALWLAAANGHAPVVERLLQAGARTDLSDQGLDNDTPLHAAAQRGQVSIVRMLVAAGAAPYLKNDNQKTAHDLAWGPDPAAVEIRAILEGGAAESTLTSAAVLEPEEDEACARATINVAALARARSSRGSGSGDSRGSSLTAL